MGNTAPTSEEDEFAEFDGIETLGYRVLGVQPHSPASIAGLVSFFDFLVGANEQMLLGSGEGLDEGEEYEDLDFPAMLHEKRGTVVELLVWNIKAQEKRLVELVPNDDWDGAGLLGVTIKLDDYGGADERLVRVLDVEKGSPASVAGLVKEKDFMLGTTSVNFNSASVLASVLEESVDQVVEIYVYNSDSDMVRVVALMPTYSWSGAGLLGAEVGTGYLHRLPNSCRSTIGQSVERKVRWTSKNQDPENNANDNTSAEVTVLEMEPHLEMEAAEDESTGQSNPEDVTRQPHELGSQVGQLKPDTSSSRENIQDTSWSGEKMASTDSGHTGSLAMQSHVPVCDPVQNVPNAAQPVDMSTSVPKDATAVFSGSPPPSETGAYAIKTYFMPAPPKMTY